MARWRKAIGLVVVALATPAWSAGGPPAFFDPLVTSAPGITREIGFLVEHVRRPDSRLTQPSVRLQYPVLSWLQFSLEMPVAFQDRDEGRAAIGAGDLLVVGQARVLMPRDWSAEIDVGLELTLPTGDREAIGGGTTAPRPFAAGGIKIGGIDALGSLAYQWTGDGPSAGAQVVEAAIAVGRPFAWITPLHRAQRPSPSGRL